MPCCVCAAVTTDSLELPQRVVCRVCAHRIGRFLETAADAFAYSEMGLGLDAIRQASIALDERAPARIAARALDLIFGQRARPNAFNDVIVRLNAEN
jgi:hypothetical protein